MRLVVGTALVLALTPAYSATASSADAALTGRVLTTSGQAVADACVLAFAPRGDADRKEVRTDRAGRYALRVGLGEAKSVLDFVLRVHPCGSRLGVSPEYVPAGDSFDDAAPITLTRGKLTRRDFRLRSAGLVYGVVSGPGGGPLADVIVRTEQWGEARGTGDTADLTEAVTDAQGRYSLPQLVPGKHRIRALLEGVEVAIAVSGGPSHLASGGQAVDAPSGLRTLVNLQIV